MSSLVSAESGFLVLKPGGAVAFTREPVNSRKNSVIRDRNRLPLLYRQGVITRETQYRRAFLRHIPMDTATRYSKRAQNARTLIACRLRNVVCFLAARCKAQKARPHLPQGGLCQNRWSAMLLRAGRARVENANFPSNRCFIWKIPAQPTHSRWKIPAQPTHSRWSPSKTPSLRATPVPLKIRPPPYPK